jgi:hypothetical protein
MMPLGYRIRFLYEIGQVKVDRVKRVARLKRSIEEKEQCGITRGDHDALNVEGLSEG